MFWGMSGLFECCAAFMDTSRGENSKDSVWPIGYPSVGNCSK